MPNHAAAHAARERLQEAHGILFALELQLEDAGDWATQVRFDIGQAMAYLEDSMDYLGTE